MSINSQNFINWLEKLKEQFYKVALAWPCDIEFKVGPYGLASASLGVWVCDNISRNAVNLFYFIYLF